MSVAFGHIFRQGAAVSAIARTVLRGVFTRPAASMETPGPRLEQTVPPRADVLVRDFARWAGGSEEAYEGTVPPHLFPQWALPLAARTLDGIPYDIRRVLNGGCRMELGGPIPAGEPLRLAAWLESIDDNGRRAVLRQQLVTGTADQPELLRCTGYVIVPLKRGDGGKKERPTVPEGATLLLSRSLSASAGRDFAWLTGDVNPVHWVRPLARLAGFPSTILHGYATLAIAMEALLQALPGGVGDLEWVDVQFTRPVVLPATVGVFWDGEGGLWVGTAPGEPAFMVGSFGIRGRASA